MYEYVRVCTVLSMVKCRTWPHAGSGLSSIKRDTICRCEMRQALIGPAAGVSTIADFSSNHRSALSISCRTSTKHNENYLRSLVLL